MRAFLVVLLLLAWGASGEQLVETMSKSELRRAFLQAKRSGPKKDYRRLKKQEGAIKLVGGQSQTEGTNISSFLFSRGNRIRYLALSLSLWRARPRLFSNYKRERERESLLREPRT